MTRRRWARSAAWLLIVVLAIAVLVRSTSGPPAFHADPGFQGSPADRAPFRALLDAFEGEAVAFGRPVLLIHGDSHHFLVDQPLKARATERSIGNVTRLEVPGSPLVGWVRVVVTPGATPAFAFEERLVPRWKYW